MRAAVVEDWAEAEASKKEDGSGEVEARCGSWVGEGLGGDCTKAAEVGVGAERPGQDQAIQAERPAVE